MAKNDDFELDFDFEKEFGVSSEELLNLTYDEDDDYDSDLLSDIPMAAKKSVPQNVQPPVAPAEEPEYDAEDDANFLDEYNALLAESSRDNQLMDEVNQVLSPDNMDEVDEPAHTKPRKQFKLPMTTKKPRRENPLKAQRSQENALFADASTPQPDAEPENIPLQNSTPAPRRKKRSQERIIKEDYLPVGIAGVALLLCLVFIIGSVVRNIDRDNEKLQNEILASEQAASEAIRLQEEAEYLLEQAAIKASGYDYQGAIEMLDSFSGDMNNFTQILSDRGKYSQLLSTVVEIT
ncbi:MAG: hypothetical protein UHS47_01165, partial [Oscillospiraceae bacterium]|nr:hypothetical protein [Oscillospiraceae bacterium]